MAQGGRADGLLVAIGACLAAGCTLGGVHALPPGDGGVSAILTDAGDDAGECAPGEDGDADGVSDCDELADDDPFTDPAVYNGLTAMIGERPEWGSCNDLDDHAEMRMRFAASSKMMDVRAGWDFDTGADAYSDPSYGFEPSWAMAAPAERFSLRFAGRIRLAAAGTQCFSIDIGAAGTDVFLSGNNCGQIYLGGGPTWLAETGHEAASVDAKLGCVELPAGDYDLDLVFWYYNLLAQAKLHVLRCTSASGPCTPDQPLATKDLHALP